jgi:hypothetical protein
MTVATAQAINAATGYRDGGRPKDENSTQVVNLRDAYGRITVKGAKAGDYQHYRIDDRNVQLAWNADRRVFYVSSSDSLSAESRIDDFTNLRDARTFFANVCRKARSSRPNKTGTWVH